MKKGQKNSQKLLQNPLGYCLKTRSNFEEQANGAKPIETMGQKAILKTIYINGVLTHLVMALVC